MTNTSAAVAVTQEALKAAYIQGATDVHEHWFEIGETPHGDPDFGGSASDYAASVALDASIPSTDTGKLVEAVKPWAHHHGPLPDYDSPLACVFDSGVQYAVELLAKTLGVEDYDVCDGTEEYDGDLGGTMFNIVLAALPKDEHGDELHLSELPSVISRDALAALSNHDAEGPGRG